MGTFAIFTLGCKLNFSESSDIARQLKERMWEEVRNTPDVIIVNSCAVTASAVKKTRNLVSRLNREYPDAKMVVVGCYAALQPEILKQWSGVCAVFGNEDKINLIPYLQGEPIPQSPHFFSTFSSGDRTRSFLKIQDGCDYHCSYCTVARARGVSRSDTISNVMAQLETIARLGMKEVNLTGVNIGDFGKGGEYQFYDLLREIDRRSPVERVRISSVEPDLLKDEIIDLVAQSQVLMPHFHIPLQSGSDAVLADMRRRYQRSLFADKVDRIKTKIPHACIAIDIISGFPTEGDNDFEDSFNFIKNLPISYLHVFTYSKRPDTPAAAMPQLHDALKKERTARLLLLSEQKQEKFYNEFENSSRPVLYESDNDKGIMYGFTDNYIKVKTSFETVKVNRILTTFLTKENMIKP